MRVDADEQQRASSGRGGTVSRSGHDVRTYPPTVPASSPCRWRGSGDAGRLPGRRGGGPVAARPPLLAARASGNAAIGVADGMVRCAGLARRSRWCQDRGELTQDQDRGQTWIWVSTGSLTTTWPRR
jgi:hypothetical protein